MRPEDLDAVLRIEAETFPIPWSRSSFESEIRAEGRQARCRVLVAAGVIAAYLVAWFIVDEVHLANIAVSKEHRGRGFGRSLVSWLIREAKDASMAFVILEVRVTNVRAIKLYESFGFRSVSVRPGYYRDRDKTEDARVMLLALGDSSL